MNSKVHNTAAGQPASIEVERLSECSMGQLHAFRNVVRHLAETITAFTCQPRFEVEATGRLNTAGELLDEICELMFNLESAAVKAAKDASPTTASEATCRAWTIIGYEADARDNLADFSVLAATAARDEAAAEYAERRAARKAVAA